LLIISNSNWNTIEEISEKIGLKPEYVESVLSFLSDLGIVDEEYGRFYIHEEKKHFYETRMRDMISTLEVPTGFKPI